MFGDGASLRVWPQPAHSSPPARAKLALFARIRQTSVHPAESWGKVDVETCGTPGNCGRMRA